MILLLSIFNFILCSFHAYKSYNEGKLTFIFWFGSLFFFGFPNIVDSIAVYFGYGSQLENYLYLQDINYDFNFNQTNMILMTIFVLLVNIAFAFGDKVSIVKQKLIADYKYTTGQFEKILAILNYVFLAIFLFNYKGSWFEANFYRETNLIYQFSVIVVCICTSISYNYAMNDKKTLAILNLIPSIFISFVTAERPYIAPAFGIIFLWLANSQKNSTYGLIKLIIAGVVSVFIMRYVRISANEQEFDWLGIVISRDSSTSVLYYIFQSPDYYLALTHGKATLFLLLTGIVPSFILGDRNFALVDIPSILAQDKFSWDFGTIHPTLYGWFYIDLGYYAIAIAFLLGFIINNINRVTERYSSRFYPIYVVAFSIFIFTGLRGSLQVAYSKAFYIFAIGIVFIILYKFLANKNSFR